MLDIIVEVIALTGFPHSCKKYISSGLRTATYTVTISVDDKVFLTRDFSGKENDQRATSTEGNKGSENLEYKFGCKISKTSVITVKVECKHSGSLHKTHQISTQQIDVFDDIQLNEEVPIKMKYESKKNLEASVYLPSKPMEYMYTAADLEGLGIVSQILNSEVGLESPEWVNFLGSMGTLLKIAEPVKEVDPHAKLALSAAEFAFEMFMKQKERDKRVLGLVRTVTNLYQMILDSNPLEKCYTLSNSINDLISLTRECAYFIAEYSKTTSFAQRTIVNAVSNADDLITLFEKQFFTLKEIFFAGIILSIGQISIRIMGKLEKMDGKLDELVDALSLPVLGRSWNKLDGYIEGPQDVLLPKIYKWGSTCDDTVPNIFLLLGESKCGKSAVANTVADFFHGRGRLGATVFFDSKNAHKSKNFFPSIIRELSKYEPAIYEKVMSGLRKNPKFRNDSLLRQFDFLRDDVLSQLTMIGPTVIIVDGLDKCPDKISLLVQLMKFPANIRLLIVSQKFDELDKFMPTSKCVTHEMKPEVSDLQLHIIDFLTVIEQYRPNIFANIPVQDPGNEIYIKSFGIYSIAQGILKCICVADDDEVLKLLEALQQQYYLEYPIEALEKIRNTILSVLELDSLLKIDQINQCMENPAESVEQLVKHGYMQVVNEHKHLQHLSFVTGIDINAIAALNSHCRPSHCNFRNVLRAVPAISNLHHLPKLYTECISNALHCIFLCKCSYSPEATKQENQSAVEYLLRNHETDCIHKASPDSEMINLPGAIQRHHTLLLNHGRRYRSSGHTGLGNSLVFLTDALQHAGLSNSTDRIILLGISPEVSKSRGAKVDIEAAIYRAITENGKDILAQTEVELIESEPLTYFRRMNEADVTVVTNPLNQTGSWFVGTIPENGYCTVLWFNCLAPPSEEINQHIPEDHGDALEGRGMGFLKTLLPGDRIAILAKCRRSFQINTNVTLFTDPKEKCPPA